MSAQGGGVPVVDDLPKGDEFVFSVTNAICQSMWKSLKQRLDQCGSPIEAQFLAAVWADPFFTWLLDEGACMAAQDHDCPLPVAMSIDGYTSVVSQMPTPCPNGKVYRADFAFVIFSDKFGEGILFCFQFLKNEAENFWLQFLKFFNIPDAMKII